MPGLLRWLGLVVPLVAIVVFTAAMLIRAGGGGIFAYWGAVMPLCWAGAAVLVMIKRPWHPVGWSLLWVALALNVTEDWTRLRGVPETWEPWLAFLFETCGGYVAYAGVVALLILFPDGTRGRSEGERRFGRALMLIMGAMLLLAVVSDPVGGSDGPDYSNPLGIALVPRALIETGYLLAFLVIAVAVVWLGRRQRQEAGEQRRRYTLILYSFALLLAALVLGISLGATDLAWLPAAGLWLWIPVAFAIAVVRHGLYGMDRLVSRTVTYVVVGVAVSLVFAVPAVVVPSLFGVSSDLAVASATLASAALFNPLRRRVRHAADQRFHRTRFDAELEASDFSTRLRTIHGFDKVSVELQRVVARTIQPASVSVWLNAPGSSKDTKAPTGHPEPGDP
ncbi:hypothetical protein BH23ACT5_BH23ACT5_02350 [soil metagenome]